MKPAKTYTVIDLDEKNKELYFICLEDGSPDMKETGDHKARWYNTLKNKGLGVKIAVDKTGTAVGMIQYVPIEYSTARGENCHFINCIWIPRARSRARNFRHMGMGKALLQKAEQDAKKRGSRGMVAWGMSMPFFIKASWYKKQGYLPVDKQGIMVLLWKPFKQDIAPPKWIKQKKTPQAGKHPGKITVTVFISGSCPVQNFHCERAKRAAAELGDRVVVEIINSLDKNNIAEWGITDAVYVEDKCICAGPPQSYKTIKSKIAKALKQLEIKRG
ncbi:MAG: GNAT family N-acetyltransferase [Spirochaetales bacterium]|nr:GNAT family N-acetyltransferase [Spirochaetales bacterium]